MSAPSPDARLAVTLQAGEIALSFDYRPAWVAAIKQLPTRRFDPASRAWHVPHGFAPELLAALERAGVPADALDPLRAIARDTLARAAVRQSRAQARFEQALPGLFERHFDLFDHQRDGVRFLLTPNGTRGAILADEMGLGKTRQAIVAAEAYAPEGRILVVCPAGLKLNWAREIRLALGAEADVGIADGKRLPDARWTIVNYDLLKKHHAMLLAARWEVAILDEAHYIKNRSAQRARLLLGGPGRAARGKPAPVFAGVLDRAERVYLLTGTPITNRPLDLFGLLQAIEHPFGADLMRYAVRYCAAYSTGYGWDMKGASHLDELHAALEGSLLRRTKEEVLSLPPKLRTYMPVEVDLAAYRQVWRDYLELLARHKGRGRRLGKRTLLVEIAKLRHAAAIAKIPAAIALVESAREAGEKVLVFTGYQAVVDALCAHFGARAVRVTGKQGARARERAVAAFQGDPEVDVFVGNLRAAGVGVTLTAARQVVFVDYSFVPADHLQAEDRPCRIGQRHAVTVTYLSAVDTIDEEIEALLAHKIGVIARAIDGHDPIVSASFLDDLLAIVARTDATES